MKLINIIFALALYCFVFCAQTVNAQEVVSGVPEWDIKVELYPVGEEKSCVVRIWAPSGRAFSKDCQIGKLWKGEIEADKVVSELCPCVEKAVDPMVREILQMKIGDVGAIMLFPDAIMLIQEFDKQATLDEWMKALSNATEKFEKHYKAKIKWIKKEVNKE